MHAWHLFKRRWEAHIWVREMGRQVYLGGYEHAEHAAEAYDVAALKCKGFKVKTNFDIDRQAASPYSKTSHTGTALPVAAGGKKRL